MLRVDVRVEVGDVLAAPDFDLAVGPLISVPHLERPCKRLGLQRRGEREKERRQGHQRHDDLPNTAKVLQ